MIPGHVAAALDGPLIVLFEQNRADEPDDRILIELATFLDGTRIRRGDALQHAAREFGCLSSQRRSDMPGAERVSSPGARLQDWFCRFR